MALLNITPTAARRLAISRQRLADPQPDSTPDGIMDVFRNLSYIQIDPIRAVERTQFLVLWSRLGNYDQTHLDTLLWEERQLFEYWAHAASIVLTENYPIHQAQMRYHITDDNGLYGQRSGEWLVANESFRQYIFTRLREGGPLSSNQFEDLSTVPWPSSGWTNNRNVGRMLDFLWYRGQIMVAGREGLRKYWTLAEQHLPEWVDSEPLPEEEVVRQAAQKSLRALGVGTAKQIGTHFIKGHYTSLDTILTELVAEERVIPVSISEGETTWPGEWYIHAEDMPLLERLTAGEWQPRTTLLSPFDNLIIDRDRTELMWDFYYRMEIYVPKAKREYGYYVLPILHGDRLIGRIDPNMDRKSGKLHINAVYAEPDAPQDTATAQAIAATFADLALFLEAKEIVYGERIPSGWRGILG